MLIAVELVLAIIVLYFLLQELTIVQIMGAIVFGALLAGVCFAVYAKEMVPMAMKVFRAGAFKKSWMPMLIWVILAVWTLIKIF